jgi:hypothetical protein
MLSMRACHLSPSKRERGEEGGRQPTKLTDEVSAFPNSLFFFLFSPVFLLASRFVLPAGAGGCAELHTARAVCRRAERSLVPLLAAHAIDEAVFRYVNRLSDMLFALARFQTAQSKPKPKKNKRRKKKEKIKKKKERKERKKEKRKVGNPFINKWGVACLPSELPAVHFLASLFIFSFCLFACLFVDRCVEYKVWVAGDDPRQLANPADAGGPCPLGEAGQAARPAGAADG